MLLPFALFLGLLGAMELGRRLGASHDPEEHEEAKTGVGIMENAVFALFGLLLAFAFSGAAGRYDARRELILAEANALGTLWLRTELLPPPSRAAVQELVRGYTDARLAVYVPGADWEAAARRVTELQGPLWSTTLAAARATSDTSATMLLLPALNDVLDLTTARMAAIHVHPPLVVFVLLHVLAFGCAGLAGWRLGRAKQRHRVQPLVFAGAVALTLGITTDLELPRRGYIRVDAADQLLTDARQGMR